MKYELWEIKELTHGESAIPFFLNSKSKSFESIYKKFLLLVKTMPCAIFINTKEENK
tara:strand:- start:485 stop:655 length:171 start_codon:yes stop_codon:yes gene_type:complete